MADERPAHPVRRLLGRLVTIASLVALVVLLAVLFIVPGPFLHTDANADAGVVITERDGREIAITAYRDRGANPLAIWLGDAGGVRITAIDVDTGEQAWDTRIDEVHGSSAFLDDRALIGASERYVFLHTTFDIYVFSVVDGDQVATSEDVPHLDEAVRTLSRILHRPGDEVFLFQGSDDDAPLRELDMTTLEVREADAATVATWGCVLDWRRSFDDGEVTGEATAPPWSVEERLGGEDVRSLAIAAQRRPAPDACADALWEDDVFPDGAERSRTLGEQSGRRVVMTDGPGFEVRDAEDGSILDSFDDDVVIRAAADSGTGRFALVGDRDLRGVAPATWGDGRSSVLLTVADDGAVHETVLGRHGWFGLPW